MISRHILFWSFVPFLLSRLLSLLECSFIYDYSLFIFCHICILHAYSFVSVIMVLSRISSKFPVVCRTRYYVRTGLHIPVFMTKNSNVGRPPAVQGSQEPLYTCILDPDVLEDSRAQLIVRIPGSSCLGRLSGQVTWADS
jgi:hypothetical protein